MIILEEMFEDGDGILAVIIVQLVIYLGEGGMRVFGMLFAFLGCFSHNINKLTNPISVYLDDYSKQNNKVIFLFYSI
jgi:hypothetical protein